MNTPGSSYIKSILLIDDSKDYCNLLIEYFKRISPSTQVDVYDIEKGCPDSEYNWNQYQLVIMDYDLGNGENGLEWIRACKASHDFPAAIMLTGEGNENIIVQAFRYGIQDFLHKDELTKVLLSDSIQRATKKYRQEQVNADTITLSAHIYNKSRFLKKVEQANKNDVVLIIEVDDYQGLHDEYGIITTDKACSHIARVTNEFLKKKKIQGIVIRSGDAASAALVQGRAHSTVGKRFAEKLCETLTKNPYSESGRVINYTVSIGIAIIDTEEFDAETVFISADVACRIARNENGNSYVIYGEARKEDKDDNDIKLQMDNVFIKNRVKPFFQHIVKVSDVNSLSRKENLYTTRVNLVGRDGSMITADQFMPVLQDTNKLNTLDRWVIRFCITKLIGEYSKGSIDTGLFMTLSSSSFSDKNLFKWFEKIIDKTDFPDIGFSLILEIDIKKFLTFQNESEYLIDQLREKYGISTALLHVPNPSILEQCMKHVHFEYIRFSPTFGDVKMSADEMKELVSIAHTHDSLAIADKLETGESLAAAIDAGVDYVSGYIIQPPQEEIETAESMEI
jgi:multidomain signaling protein FimX